MIKYNIKLTALTPIAHGDTESGVDNATNTRIFMREARMINGRSVGVPHVTENSLRSVLFRRTLADHLTNGVEGLSAPMVNLLYAGGSMSKGKMPPGMDAKIGHLVSGAYPMLGLLGGAVDSMILPPGKLAVTAWIVCSENNIATERVFGVKSDVSAFDMVAQETRTRGTGGEADGNQMLYAYEVLAAGAEIMVELTLDRGVTPEQLGAVRYAIDNFDGFIGGQRRQGRGRVSVDWLTDAPDAEPYIDMTKVRGDRLAEGLRTGTLTSDRVLVAA